MEVRRRARLHPLPGRHRARRAVAGRARGTAGTPRRAVVVGQRAHALSVGRRLVHVRGAAELGLGPRTLRYAIRNHTGDRVDEFMGMPMHRGLGPHLRGTTANVRGLGGFAPPTAFGHGGVGTSYCWGDPESGVSFAYITNNRVPDPWHSRRLDLVSNLVHAAILPL